MGPFFKKKLLGLRQPSLRAPLKSDDTSGVVSCALLANWCMLEYIVLVETPDIISKLSLDAYSNMRFRHHILSFVFCSFINQGLRVAALVLHFPKKNKISNLSLISLLELTKG